MSDAKGRKELGPREEKETREGDKEDASAFVSYSWCISSIDRLEKISLSAAFTD
jgi:hypothetical protein